MLCTLGGVVFVVHSSVFADCVYVVHVCLDLFVVYGICVCIHVCGVVYIVESCFLKVCVLFIALSCGVMGVLEDQNNNMVSLRSKKRPYPI